MNQPGREPAPAGRQADDLGLTRDDWDDLRVSYIFGNTDPAPGSVEAEAFRRIAESDRREADRRLEQEARSDAIRRFTGRPFPGGPLTAALTGREAAELSVRLFRGSNAAKTASYEIQWPSPDREPMGRTAGEIDDAYRDVEAETVVSGARLPGEHVGDFRRRAEREPAATPDPGLFDRLLRPAIEAADPEPEAELEPPW